MRRQDFGRLVQDKRSRTPEQLFEDFDLLLVADRKLPCRHRRIDVEAKPFGVVTHTLKDFATRHDRRQIPLKQRHIVEHAERRNEREILKHHANAERTRVARRGYFNRPAVDSNLAGVRCVVAVENLGEGAFAGAVLPEQRQHFAGIDAEMRDIVGEEVTKPLDDASGFKKRRLRGANHGPTIPLPGPAGVKSACVNGMHFAWL